MREWLDHGSVDYQVARSNDTWVDHQARTLVTAALIVWLRPRSILDPACGDGSIVLSSLRHHVPERVLLTDVSIPSISALVDSDLPACVSVRAADLHYVMEDDELFDLIVLTETLEHLKDPVWALERAREKSGALIASSPEMRPGQYDDNPEHLWQFDGDGYLEMLMEAGWQAMHKTHMGFPQLPYDFQIWVCR